MTLLEHPQKTCTEILHLKLQPHTLLSDLREALQKHFIQQEAGLTELAYHGQTLESVQLQHELAPYLAVADSNSTPRFTAAFARRVHLQLRYAADRLFTVFPLETDTVREARVLASRATG